MMCNYCNYTSPKRYLLTRHMKSHSEDRPHKCNICERCFKTMASLQNHVNTHTGTRPHKCKQCEAAFTTSGELVRHIRYKHTFEKPHKCTECDYASVELSKLKRHMRSHTGERPYQCPHCQYASPDTYKLKRHMRIHTGEKPYECDVCHAKFTQSNSLKAHKLIHSGNKPVFQCELCPTTCGRKTDLKIHMQKLHTSEKPLVCRKCNKTLPDRYTYKMHIKSHDGEKCFKCDHCDYAALSQRHLESHSLTHTGEKPFECDECEHTFRQKQLLKRHKNLYHTPDYSPPEPKDKMYDCTECDKSFAHKGNLLRHMQLHDPDNPLYRDIDDSSPTRRRSIENSSVPLTAEQLLQGSILNEMKEGKLGNTPKVVIVHPDGRVEEVTSKLQSMVQEKTMEDMLLAAVEQADNSGMEHVTSQQVSQTQPSGTTVQNIFTTVPVVSVNGEQKSLTDNTAKIGSFESVIIPIVTQSSLPVVNIVSSASQNSGITSVLSTDNSLPVTVYQQGTSTLSEQPVPITLQQGTSTVSIVNAKPVNPKNNPDGSSILILPGEERKDVETQAAIESGDEAEEVYHIVHVADSTEETSHGNLHIDLSLNNQQSEIQGGRKRKDPESEMTTVNKKQCT
ncbi:hypothetical protein KUTeg_019996 [Tegillarca granosa]|uniref:C2H2-type domain-containing protein n=1 Tax=Tegillarca granosa TaxID=220873 RepID=A0ABQ9EJN0_TEGGR|nr:hypothetical protein KUTeg_019996 [Tegillarca granosa]